jgi:hypothetical protein
MLLLLLLLLSQQQQQLVGRFLGVVSWQLLQLMLQACSAAAAVAVAAGCTLMRSSSSCTSGLRSGLRCTPQMQVHLQRCRIDTVTAPCWRLSSCCGSNACRACLQMRLVYRGHPASMRRHL